MTKTSLKSLLIAGSFCVALLGASPSWAAVDWSGVPAKDVTLFYPGQSSFEWVMTPTDHEGAEKFRGGKNCHQCHAGDEKTMGDLLVSGKKNEPNPIAGKPGSVAAKVKIAHDDENLYVHLEFAEGSQPDAGMDKDFATKVTMMLNDGGVPEANRAGCWAMCHDDASSMPSAAGATRTKYLNKTRAHLTRQGGGDELKSADDLAKLTADGYALEYWQARLNPSGSSVAVNGSVFSKREETKPTAVTVESKNSGGVWSVTFTRKLNAGANFKPIVAGKPYTIGFAIHAGHTAKRFHYVSFEHSLVLDQGDADFVAVKQ
jgi:cytochrome c-type protein NapC